MAGSREPLDVRPHPRCQTGMPTIPVPAHLSDADHRGRSFRLPSSVSERRLLPVRMLDGPNTLYRSADGANPEPPGYPGGDLLWQDSTGGLWARDLSTVDRARADVRPRRWDGQFSFVDDLRVGRGAHEQNRAGSDAERRNQLVDPQTRQCTVIRLEVARMN
jgi:hypothetical protein